MIDPRCAFITGGTGLLGVNLVRELIKNTSAKIVLLVRNPTPEKRAKFFNELLSFGGGLWPVGFSYKRIQFVNGDVVQPHLGMTPGVRSRLYREIDILYHSAAVIKLSGAEAETQAVNVQGTKNVLDFAWQCKMRGRLDRVVHVSTIGVSGTTEGVFYENDLDVGQGFNSPYEKSKFQAEQLVGQYRDRGMNIIIVRPSMIIGDSQTGYTNHFNIFYLQLRLLAKGLIEAFPLRCDSTYNLIPADYTARAIFLISNKIETRNGNFHVVNSHEVNVSQMLDKTCSYLGYKKPVFVSVPALNQFPVSTVGGIRGWVLNIYFPYICKKITFDAANAGKIYREHQFAWPRLDGAVYTNMLDACIFSGYLPPKCEYVKDEVVKS